MLQMRKSKFGKVKWLSKVIHLVGSDPRVYNSFLQIEDIGDSSAVYKSPRLLGHAGLHLLAVSTPSTHF